MATPRAATISNRVKRGTALKMPQNWPIGLAAGLMSALVFVSANAGPIPVRALLFALTPLAIALAGLGWGWRNSIVAGVAGTGVLGALSGNLIFTSVFALTQALPMAVLVYLAGLSRPAEEATEPPLKSSSKIPLVEWYPVGRLVIWAAIISVLLAIFGMLLVASSPEFAENLSKIISTILKSSDLPSADSELLTDEKIRQISDATVKLIPAYLAISTTVVLLFNLWLAGRITFASGQLERPWPDISGMSLPIGVLFTLVVAMLGHRLLPDPYLMVTKPLVSALLFLYFLLGLAVVHYTTRYNPWRMFFLFAFYLCLITPVGLPATTLLGLSESFLRLRSKYGGPPDPPSTPTQST